MKNKQAAQAGAETYPLSPLQVEQVYLFIECYVIRHGIACDDLQEYFDSHADSFVSFMLDVERTFRWFDYTQSTSVIEILDIYIQRVNEDINS